MKYVGKWMEPENLLLSKATQTQKTKHYHMLSYLSWFQILRSECTQPEVMAEAERITWFVV